ncbi:MAG: gas vesicle protein [Candidatus Scalindua rubra]|uniref:Gas vesicle protein n=1 Tax=Candidatus Scalindua rubra TaxID=1872076 RepID=A0A1E3XFB6_9BACT|nr:MAG: gas vesicle protein [Candidatus Scalindua rubra]
MDDAKKYIYGVINLNNGDNFQPIKAGWGNQELYAISHQDIACVVSDSPGLNLEIMEKEELGRYLVNHQSAIEEVMKTHTIIPIKFGTEVENKLEVGQILERGYSKFKDRLKNFDGKIELDVTAVWSDLNKIIKVMGEEDKEIRDFKEKIARKPPGETLQDRIKIGVMIKTALEKKNEETQNQIIDCLKEKAIDFQKHKIMDDRMILTCAFLLDRDKESEFDEALNELDKRHDGLINFKCVGPLPPYSFTTMEVKKVGFRQLNEAGNLLDLGEEVTADDIKDSYRKKTLDCHPDKDPDDPVLAERFEEITRAYKMLTSFCRGEKCSFKSDDVKDFFLIEAMKI